MKEKKLDYKSKKWDKKIAELKKSDLNLTEDFNVVEQFIKKDEPDFVRYHSIRTSYFYTMGLDEYMIGNYDKSLECMNKCLDEWVQACDLLSKGYKVSKVIEENIKRGMKTGVEGYLAVALNREQDLNIIMDSDSKLRLLLRKDYSRVKELCEHNEPIDGMMEAICNYDSIMFESELKKRIKEVRNVSWDYLSAIDIWAVSLVKIARRQGMDFYCNYIEIPDFLLA